MNQSPDKKNRRMPRPLLVWLAAFILVAVAIALVTLTKQIATLQNLYWGSILSTSFVVTTAPVLLWVSLRWACMRRNWGRALVGLAGLATLFAIFYLEEDWRGKRAWENCKRELEAKGAVLDWNKFIPPPVPDDQNFFAAPKMQDWFTGRGMRDLSTRLQSTNYNNLTTSVGGKNLITNAEVAKVYLAWSDQFAPDFNLIHEALKRPYARMDGDYSQPFEIPIPNFLTERIVAQVLSQRAHCYFLLNEPEKALGELTFLNDSRRLLEGAPTGKPMTLVAAMINVAVAGLYVNTVADGFQRHAWPEQRLIVLQKQLAEVNLAPFVLQALQEAPASACRDAEILPLYQLMNFGRTPKWPDKIGSWLWPRGWTYQNMVNVAVLELRPLDGFDLAHDTVAPRRFDESARDIDMFFRHKSPYKILAAIAIPNFSKAEQTTAHNQTLANEAQIVCALERYRLAHGEYPEKLDALVPQFIEKVPHDIIGGAPLIYRALPDGKFLLYSIGLNETDDGGQDGGNDFTIGDCVWKNQPQMNTDSHR